MASTYGFPVLFSKEKNVWILAARVQFGASGVTILDTSNSKGICSIMPDQVSFNSNTVASSATTSSVTSFSGLFNGMTVTGITAGVGSNITISSMNANTGAITLSSGTNVLPQAGNALIATGGRYRIQFGTQSGTRLDPYVKLLGFNCDWREISGSATGTATTLQLYPAATDVFVVQNNIPIRTIPPTSTSGSTDASLVIQMGFYGASDNIFTAVNPQAGEIAHMTFILGNSTAP